MCVRGELPSPHRIAPGAFPAVNSVGFPMLPRRGWDKLRLMRFLSRRAHGSLDYIVGVLLVLAPRLLGLDEGGAEQRVPEMLGIAVILYSLLTNYELGVLKFIPFRTHLTLDVLGGIFLALSPWLFQFVERVWVPHLIVGLAEIAVPLMTRTTATARHTTAPGSPAHS